MSKKYRPVPLLATAVMLIACCGGKLYGILPFGTPMFCALSGEFFVGFISPIYLLCGFLFTFDVWRLYVCGAVIFIMSVRWILSLKIQKLDCGVANTLFSMFAIVTQTVISGVFAPIANVVISGFVGCVFYCFAKIAASCARKEFSTKPSVADCVALCVVLFVFGLACGRAEYGELPIGLAPAMLCIFVSGVIGIKPLLAVGISIGLGVGINGESGFMPAILSATLAVAAFGRLARPAVAVSATGMFVATEVLFYCDYIVIAWSAVFCAVGGLMFCVIPKNTIRGLRDYFDFDGSSRLAVRHYINRIKADAGNRMLAVASVFGETARLMNSICSPPPDYAAMGVMIAEKICAYCPVAKKCDKNAASAAFTELAEVSCSGRAILSGLPEFFTSDCAQASQVINESAAITDASRERERERDGEIKAKAIVTERLFAVKDVLEQLGRSQALPVGFDAETERNIVAEINNNGVECAEAFCTREGVFAIVRTAQASYEKIRRAVSACLKRRCEVLSLDKTQAAGWSVATLKKRPKYEAVYARAGLSKDGVTGDSYTFERIGDRFLAALLDGMGSGVRACESSSAAVELTECFYRAGFDSQAVIAGVNRFLKLPSAESYSAADIVVCDLDSATADIIKIGAPPCYIKTADTVLKISGGSLPIGVLDEMRPFVTVKKLYPGQMMILVTDGIDDCFSGDGLPEYINGLSSHNPESVATSIVSRALALSGGTPKDDMTVVAFRLFEKKDD